MVGGMIDETDSPFYCSGRLCPIPGSRDISALAFFGCAGGNGDGSVEKILVVVDIPDGGGAGLCHFGRRDADRWPDPVGSRLLCVVTLFLMAFISG